LSKWRIALLASDHRSRDGVGTSPTISASPSNRLADTFDLDRDAIVSLRRRAHLREEWAGAAEPRLLSRDHPTTLPTESGICLVTSLENAWFGNQGRPQAASSEGHACPATRYRSLSVLAVIAPKMHPGTCAFQQAPAVVRHRSTRTTQLPGCHRSFPHFG